MTNTIKALIAVGAVAATSALTAVAAIAVKKIIVNKTLNQAEELVNENETEEVEISEEEKAEVRESMKAEAEELAENSRLVKGLEIASITIGAFALAALCGMGIGLLARCGRNFYLYRRMKSTVDFLRGWDGADFVWAPGLHGIIDTADLTTDLDLTVCNWLGREITFPGAKHELTRFVVSVKEVPFYA